MEHAQRDHILVIIIRNNVVLILILMEHAQRVQENQFRDRNQKKVS